MRCPGIRNRYVKPNRNHVKSFTYEPKIKAVRKGSITQTIRKRGKVPVKVGDKILFHGWEDRPYRSKWSWRLKTEITAVVDITVYAWGIEDMSSRRPWRTLNLLAELDGIEPPTGEELGRVLTEKNKGDFVKGELFQIIRWKVLQ
jgi:co-chaperonin GroES (HSP10)